jgi:multidrug efflux pump
MASGAGAESRQDIGWVIVGGLTLGTLFTLFVVPVVYTLMDGFEHRVKRLIRRIAGRPTREEGHAAASSG